VSFIPKVGISSVRRPRKQRSDKGRKRGPNRRTLGRVTSDPSDFHLGKTSDGDPQFLQIVAKTTRKADRKARKEKSQPKLTRVAFRVSRLMEFCTKRELQNQTGHAFYQWPLVVLKELMDNALDACEEAEIAPVISIAVGPETIIIQDNGDGIKASTIKSILDYSIRVSSREAYVSPTRGAQGNALKTILAMGYVLDRELGHTEAVGETVIETRGIAHRILFNVDHVNNEPRITHTTSPSSLQVGTRVTIRWPNARFKYDDRTLLDHARDDFEKLAEAYTWLNPHLSLRGTWCGKKFINVQATDPAWRKWGPRDPTSAHWYDDARLQRYLAAHVARDRDLKKDRTVREFIAEFRGMSGTAKQRQVLEEVGCSHVSLRQFFGINQVNSAGIAKLLVSMKKHTKPVAPKHLGIIGEDHLKQRFETSGGNLKTFKYTRRQGVTDEGIPYIVESAFGLHQSGLERGESDRRKVITGANWSVGINNPFRSFGRTGEGLETTLQMVRANAQQPVIFVLHLASAHIQYADRGKSSIINTDIVRQDGDE
jgi:DNA topoisomerase VI subunit B